jgi:hypothetical protein
MPGIDLFVWLVFVAIVTVAWSLTRSSGKTERIPVRVERTRDVTPLLHLTSKAIGRRYRRN